MGPTITDWLMVGITFVYVIATIFICIYNGKSAKAAREQTEEMKLQFYSVNRPIINVEIVYLKRAFYALRLTNRGAQTAFNVKIVLSQEFINSLPEESFKNRLEAEKGKTCVIGVGQNYDLFFGSNAYREIGNKPPIIGEIIYSGINDSMYSEDFNIDLQNYATNFSVDSDMDDIKKILSEQKTELNHIGNALQQTNIEQMR